MISQNGVRQALRAATAPHHNRVDALFSTADLSRRADYERFLLAQAAAHLPVEHALDAADTVAVLPDWPARRRRVALEADLAALGLDVPAAAGEIAFDSPAAILGAVYVLEGSRLGGAMLRRAVPPDLPARFLGGGDSAAWRCLLGIIDLRLADPAEQRVAINSACAVFMLFERAAGSMPGTGREVA